MGPKEDPANGCVVLLDEIDKADTDVPNGLLEALGSGCFTPFGQSNLIEVQGEPPLVVITTNEERGAPQCLRAALSGPRSEAARRRRPAHCPPRRPGERPFSEATEAGSHEVIVSAAELLVRDRRTAMQANVSPLPGPGRVSRPPPRGVPARARQTSSSRRRVSMTWRDSSFANTSRGGHEDRGRGAGRPARGLLRRRSGAPGGGRPASGDGARRPGAGRRPTRGSPCADHAGPHAVPPPVVSVAPIPFWRAETYTRIEPPREEAANPNEWNCPDDRSDPPAPLAFRPLATSAAVLTKLRRVSSFSRIEWRTRRGEGRRPSQSRPFSRLTTPALAKDLGAVDPCRPRRARAPETVSRGSSRRAADPATGLSPRAALTSSSCATGRPNPIGAGRLDPRPTSPPNQARPCSR